MNPELKSMLMKHLEDQDTDNNFDDLIYRALEGLATESELYLSVRTPNRIDIGDFTQQDFYLVFELDQTGLVVSYFIFRTNSMIYDGERTDLHDCLSLLFSLCCATNNISTSLWDVGNGFSQIEGELYARYAAVSQPSCSVITQDEAGIENISSIISVYKDFQSFMRPYKCQSSKHKSYSWDLEDLHESCRSIAGVLGLSKDDVVANRRWQPDWDYFQISSQNISIIKTPIGTRMLSGYISQTFDNLEKLCDENVTYYKSGNVKNSFSIDEVQQIQNIAKHLTDDSGEILTSESHIFAVSKEWVIAKRGDFGIERFKEERDNFSKSILNKVNFLFEKLSFKWNESGCPSRFESLCRDLLAREPLVSRVRKVSPTNQPDRSRDLIAEIIDYKPTSVLVEQSEQPLDIKKYFVQCKLTKKTLGIPSGMGPFEAMYLGGYDGYFLITNSILSSDHTAQLEKLRSDDKYNADWWVKDDIEERLKNNIDILLEYTDLVSYSHLNKSLNWD